MRGIDSTRAVSLPQREQREIYERYSSSLNRFHVGRLETLGSSSKRFRRAHNGLGADPCVALACRRFAKRRRDWLEKSDLAVDVYRSLRQIRSGPRHKHNDSIKRKIFRPNLSKGTLATRTVASTTISASTIAGTRDALVTKTPGR